VRQLRFVVILCTALGCQAGAAQSLPGATRAPSPRVECDEGAAVCRADLATYIGWRVFQAQCATCHAADALGSSFAPNLLERTRGMEQREFFAALDQGYFGPRSTMPPRGRDPNVAPYYEELWSYLIARRSGALTPGAVEPLPVEPRSEPR
jgi:mono/diheme cytochrome c family protein